MSMINTILAGIGLAAVGYGAYKGAIYLFDGNAGLRGGHDEGVDAIIERTRTQAEAEFAGFRPI